MPLNDLRETTDDANAGPRETGPAGILSYKRMVTDDEALLIAKSREGDWSAFAVLVQLHQRMIFSLTYRMSGSARDAEDLAQETFVRAYRYLNSYRGQAKFSSWLYRIALNLCLRWKKAERRRGLADHEWAVFGNVPDSPDDNSERIQLAMAQLTPKQRAAIILTFYDGLTHAEAGALLACAEKTLSGRLIAARQRLGELLTKGGMPT